MTENCENCRFAVKSEHQVGGLMCKRYPPQMVAVAGPQGGALLPVLPAVQRQHGCGEFQQIVAVVQ